MIKLTILLKKSILICRIVVKQINLIIINVIVKYKKNGPHLKILDKVS